MLQSISRAGHFTLPGASITLNRMGYGAMQLAGPGVWGPPRDVDAAMAVLRTAIDAGVDHIDTSDFYGPHVTNQIIRRALHPYPGDLTIVTKIGFRRGPDKSWHPARSRQELIDAVQDNLRNLGLETLDVVNLRVGRSSDPVEESIEAPFTVLAELQRQGLIRHLGLSNATPAQVAEAQAIAPVVCVQNFYNVARRRDDRFIDDLAAQGVAYVPFFPLGGFTPLQSSALDEAAAAVKATPMQVALAWLLQRSPNILLIPGTSSVAHLRENLDAAALELPSSVLRQLTPPLATRASAAGRGRWRSARGRAARAATEGGTPCSTRSTHGTRVRRSRS
jgi:aryl-alcohol dehydrogenase-like predicted oxidoreductase